MAIGTPTLLASYTTGTSQDPHVVTLATGAAEGTLVYVGMVIAGGRTLSGVTDSRGNTWTIPPTDGTEANGSNHGLGFAWAIVAAGKALQAGDTVTLDWSSTGVAAGEIYSVSGIDTADPFDVSSLVEAGTSSTTITSGNTAETDTADELVVGVFCHASTPSLTPEVLSPTWTIGTLRSSSGTVRSIRMGYRIVSATAVMDASGTLGTAQVNTAGVYTFRAAGASGAALAAVVAGVATVAGALTTAIAAAATVAAVATVAAALTVPKPLSATVAGTSTVTAALTASGPAGAALAAVVGGSSTVAGALTTSIRLKSVTAGVSTVAAALTTPADALAAVVAGSSSVTAALTTGLPEGIDNVVGLITVDYSGPALEEGEIYVWRGRVRDELGHWSAWSPYGSFTIGAGAGSPYDRWARTILDELADPPALTRLGTLKPSGPDEVLPIVAAEAGDRWSVLHDHVSPPIDRTVRVLGLRARLFRPAIDQPGTIEVDAITEDVHP